MKNKKIFSKAWQGIQFESFADLSKNDIADDFFYDKFYENLISKYDCFDDLDEDWLDKKTEVVDLLDGLSAPNSKLCLLVVDLASLKPVCGNAAV